MPRFNPEFQRRLIDDLRTPGLLQGRQRLTTVNEDGTEEDCCLGRVCKLAGVGSEITTIEGHKVRIYGTVEERDELKRSHDSFAEFHIYGGYTVLPGSVQDYTMAQGHDPDFGGDTMAGMNDNGAPFALIADMLEQELSEVPISWERYQQIIEDETPDLDNGDDE